MLYGSEPIASTLLVKTTKINKLFADEGFNKYPYIIIYINLINMFPNNKVEKWKNGNLYKK